MIIDADIVVIGGGIVGLSTAMQLLERYPGRAVWVLEKEARLASHQAGRNSRGRARRGLLCARQSQGPLLP
jgi:L-2-hydroxyglutarate oxidase